MTISPIGRPGYVWDGTNWVPIMSAPNDGTYIGTIVAWSGQPMAVPTGWQLCDGSAPLSASLQVLVGATVPDLRGRFIMGQSATHPRGETGGADTVTLTAAQSGVADHSHSLPLTTSPQGASNTLDQAMRGTANSNGDSGFRTSMTTATGVYNSAPGPFPASQAHQNLPPYWSLAWIIKHTGSAANGMTKAEGDTFYAPIAEAWQNLPLQAGWASISGYVTPRFRKEGAVIAVEYVGACAAGAASPSVVGTLPVGYRPTNTVRVVGTFTYASAKDGPAFFDIASSGAITFVSLRDTAGGVLAGGSASFVTRFSPT